RRRYWRSQSARPKDANECGSSKRTPRSIRTGLVRRRLFAVWGDVLRRPYCGVHQHPSWPQGERAPRLRLLASARGDPARRPCRLEPRRFTCRRNPLTTRMRPAYSRSLTPTASTTFSKERTSGEIEIAAHDEQVGSGNLDSMLAICSRVGAFG